MERKIKQRLDELEHEFLMYKKQMNILSGLSNNNLMRLDNLIKCYGVMVTNKELKNILIRMRSHFEKTFNEEFKK